MMVNAGALVDDVMGEDRAAAVAGDILVDGGNSLFADTERRSSSHASGLCFVGAGVPAARRARVRGPAIMPGGPVEALDRAATDVRGDQREGRRRAQRLAHIGPAAGHYVKMVHNGIEYGDMK